MFFLVSVAISCGNAVVIDGLHDIRYLRPTSSRCLLVHQSWKTDDVPEKFRALQNTWRNNNTVRTVLWTDNGNFELVAHYYPQWISHYQQLLALPAHSGGAVMAADWARLLYLHKFGGIYVDLDYEAHVSPVDWPVVRESRTNPSVQNSVYFVNSPFVLTEVMQNSLMYAPEPAHPFFLHVCETIQTTLEFIETPYCPDDTSRTTDPVSARCQVVGAFTNRWTKSVAWLLKTEQITGPPVLDKTYTQLSLGNNPVVDRVLPLPTAEYFGHVDSNTIGPGKYATHWHANSWVNMNPVKLMPALSFTILVGLFAAMALAFYIGKQKNRPVDWECFSKENGRIWGLV